MKNNFGSRWKSRIFATPKSIGNGVYYAVVTMADLPLYGGGTGNGHTATNRAEDTQAGVYY